MSDMSLRPHQRASAAGRARAKWVVEQYNTLVDTIGRVQTEDSDLPTYFDIVGLFNEQFYPDPEDMEALMRVLDPNEVAAFIHGHLEYRCEPFPTELYAGARPGDAFEADYAAYLRLLSPDAVLFELCCALHSVMESDDDRTVIKKNIHRMKLDEYDVMKVQMILKLMEEIAKEDPDGADGRLFETARSVFSSMLPVRVQLLYCKFLDKK